MEFRNLITVASDDASWMERHLGLEERARTIWFRWNVRKETKPWKLEGTWGKSDSSECWNKKIKCSLILPENAERNFFLFFFSNRSILECKWMPFLAVEEFKEDTVTFTGEAQVWLIRTDFNEICNFLFAHFLFLIFIFSESIKILFEIWEICFN